MTIKMNFEIYLLNQFIGLFIILGVFTEKPYSKPLKLNVVYIPFPIITTSHATSNEFKCRQNKPWLSTIGLDVGDVITSLTLFRC